MNNTVYKIKKYIKEITAYIYLTLLIIILIICLLYIGELQGADWKSSMQLLSAFLGSAVVATITFILLKGQTKSQNTVQQNTRIFENKLQAYESFLNDLQYVVVKNDVTTDDEKMLQFAVAAISMHTDSKELLRISQCLKEIIQKIRTKESVDNTMWHELMEIVYIFQRSLYMENSKALDSNIEQALRNFSSIAGCENEIYSLLEYVECNLSSYRRNTRISTYIEDKCLHIIIPIKNKIRKGNDLPSEIYLTLQVVRMVGNKYHCRMGLYFAHPNSDKLDDIYNDNRFWTRRMSVIKSTDWKFGADTVKKVVGLGYADRDKQSILTTIYDLINVINPLWVDKSMNILRKDKDGNIIKENPYNKR